MAKRSIPMLLAGVAFGAGLCVGWLGRALVDVSPGGPPFGAGRAVTEADPASAVTKDRLSIGSATERPGRLTGDALTDRTLGRIEEARLREAELEREIADLRARLLASEQQHADEKGSPVAWPVEVEPRFERRRLAASLKEAFEASGVPARVTEEECLEYPCVVVGSIDGPGDPALFERVMESEAFDEYRNDKRLTSLAAEDRPDGQGSLFGIGIYRTADGQPDEELRRRTEYRIRELIEAVRSGR